jgi:hypothetical protein
MKSKKTYTLIPWTDVALNIYESSNAKLNASPYDEQLESEITDLNTLIANWLFKGELNAYNQSGGLLGMPENNSQLKHVYVNVEAVNKTLEKALEEKGHLKKLVITVTKEKNEEEPPWIAKAKEIANDFYLKVKEQGNPPRKNRVVKEVVERLKSMKYKTKNGIDITIENANKQAFLDWEPPKGP